MNNHHHHRELETPALCDFHPRQVIVGICPLCLKERLIILAAAAASKQDHNFIPYYYKEYSSSSMVHHETAATSNNVRNKSLLALKIYALRSFLHRHLEFRKSSSSDNFHADGGGDCRGYESTSQEDSFISIKFQDNEVVSWDKGTKIPKEQNLEKLSSDHTNLTTNKEQTKTSAMNKDTRLPSSTTTTTTTGINKNNNSVVEHVKSHAVLKWRKRIGQLFQITRWKKRSSSDKNNKTSVNHVMINRVSSSGRGVKMRKGNGKNPSKEKKKMGEM